MSKLAIITGANTGLGFETARALLADDYHIVMANRDLTKTRDAVSRLSKKADRDRIDYFIMDLENRASIEEFSAGFERKYGHFDVLVNNGGTLLPKYSLSRNGIERHFDVNYLGHFYLNSLIMNMLAPDGLVVSLGSLAHKMKVADINFKDISFKNNKYDKMTVYAQSKLALTLYGVELARKFEGSGRRSLIAHPGVSNTDIVGRHYGRLLARMLMPVVNLYGISGPREGASSIIYAIREESIPNGSYIGPQGKKEWSGCPGYCQLSDKALDQELARQLWQFSEELTGDRFIID